jgi:hypothetical protein
MTDMSPAVLLVVVLLLALYSVPCALIAGNIAEDRGTDRRTGFLLGLFLGVFGILIASVL